MRFLRKQGWACVIAGAVVVSGCNAVADEAGGTSERSAIVAPGRPGGVLACSGAQSIQPVAPGSAANRTYTGIVFANDNDSAIAIDRIVVYAVDGSKLCDLAGPAALGPRQSWVFVSVLQPCIPFASSNVVGVLRFVVWWSHAPTLPQQHALRLNPLDGNAAILVDDAATFVVRGRSTRECKPIFD